MRTRIIAILIVLAFICIALPNNNPFVEQARADNLAGDLDQLPENEELLNLSGGFGRPMYEKNNTLVYAVTDGNQNAADFFNGEHTGARIASGWITVDFPYSMRITRIRLYPKGSDQGGMSDTLMLKKRDNGGKELSLWSSSTSTIMNNDDYLEKIFPNLITNNLWIMSDTTPSYLNEVEIYYDKYFNPYHYTSEINYNYTNITNEYNNDTYIDNTYVNDTYLNVTYDNTTYQNVTYLNLTNQTGGEVFYNTTNEFVNYTYLNETLVQDNKILEDKLNDLWNELNESKGGEATKDSKSLADKTYSDPILIILLLAILVFQFILFLQRKRNRERDQSIEKEAAIEPEIEHTPGRGLTKETDIDIISRNVQQAQAPQDQYSAQYHQYQHKPTEPPIQQPQSSPLTQPQQTEIQTPPPVATVSLLSEPPVTPPSAQSNIPYDPNDQKALPEHKLTP